MQHKLTISIAMLLALIVMPLFQAQAATNTIGRVMFTYGPAWIQQGSTLTKIKRGDTVAARYSIVTGPRARVKVQMNDGSNIYIGSKSKVALQQYAMKGKSLLSGTINMLWGKARFFVNKLTNSGASFRVRTPTAVLGVRGTWFIVSVPPTPELLNRAFDSMELGDMPPLPTRTVLMEGAVDVGTGTGNPTRLTPGQTADVNSRRSISVRKSKTGDIDNHRDTTPKRASTKKNKPSSKDSGDSPTNKGGTARDGGKDKDADNGDAGDTPDKPKPSDAGRIMNSGNDDADTTDAGANNPTPSPSFSPTTTAPAPSRAPETQTSGQKDAVANAVQNLGATDVTLKPSFVAP